MTPNFLFSFGGLNLASLSPEKKKRGCRKVWSFRTKVVKVFEYEKNNNWCWDRAKLHKQIVNKVLLITKAFYSWYSILVLLDNTISYFVYAKYAF